MQKQRGVQTGWYSTLVPACAEELWPKLQVAEKLWQAILQILKLPDY